MEIGFEHRDGDTVASHTLLNSDYIPRYVPTRRGPPRRYNDRPTMLLQEELIATCQTGLIEEQILIYHREIEIDRDRLQDHQEDTSKLCN